MNSDLDEVFERLNRSDFRRRFRLRPAEREYLERKGLDAVMCKYSVNPSPALAFSRSDGYSRPSWTTDQPPCSVSRPCGSQSRNWHPSPLVRHRIPRHRNPFVPPRPASPPRPLSGLPAVRLVFYTTIVSL